MSETRDIRVTVADSSDVKRGNQASSPSRAILQQFSEREETDPVELAPIHDTSDPEYLDHLFKRTVSETGANLEVSFSYEGYDVTISDQSNGR